jgi:hypothetical protein
LDYTRAFGRLGEIMIIEQITDIAYEIVSELEPAYGFDVFDVTDSHVIFQNEHGLKRVCLSCATGQSLKDQIKEQLRA